MACILPSHLARGSTSGSILGGAVVAPSASFFPWSYSGIWCPPPQRRCLACCFFLSCLFFSLRVPVPLSLFLSVSVGVETLLVFAA